MDQGMNNMEVEGEEKRGKKSRLICLYDDWIDGNPIGHDPLIYREGGGLILVGNLFKAYFLSFSYQNRSRNKSVRDLKVRFGINTYRYFQSDSTSSTGPYR
jgi:hypothetical protein